MIGSRRNRRTAIPNGKKALVRAVVATVLFVISAVFTAYGIVCPTSMGRCLPDAANHLISGTSIFLLVVGTLFGLFGILSAVESVVDSEKTPTPYIALALLLVSTLGITGGVYAFIVLKIAALIFPGKI